MANMSAQSRINESLTPRKQKGGRKKLIASGSIIIVMLSIVLVVFLSTRNNAKEYNRVVTPDNVEDVIKGLKDEKVPSGNYEVKMNTSWTFENGSSPSSDAYVENAAANSSDVYFTIVRTDTQEQIYSSPVIPIGSRIADIALDSKLPKGKYDCVITYHLVDKDNNETSSVNLSMDITVEK